MCWQAGHIFFRDNQHTIRDRCKFDTEAVGASFPQGDQIQGNYAIVKMKQFVSLISFSFSYDFIILTDGTDMCSKERINYKVNQVMKQKGKEASKKKAAEVQEQEEVEDLELEQTNFNEIEKLQEYGINAADIAKLKANGFCTISSIVMAPKKELTNVKGINQAKIDKIMEVVKKIENHGFMSGNQVAIKRKNVVKITTGSPLLDELLGGGI